MPLDQGVSSVEIPIGVVSLNVLRRKYKHRHAYKRLRDSFGWALKAARADRALGIANGPRRLRIVRLMAKGAKRYDRDNLVGGAKPLVDNLVAMGILLDDTEDAVAIEYAQERAGSVGTRIEVLT